MTDYTDLIARLREAHANSPQRIAGSMIFDEAAAAIAALTAERDALQAHIAQEAEFLATVTAAKHEAEREVERLRGAANIALDGWQSWVDDQLSGTSYYDGKCGEIAAVRSCITTKP